MSSEMEPELEQVAVASEAPLTHQSEAEAQENVEQHGEADQGEPQQAAEPSDDDDARDDFLDVVVTSVEHVSDASVAYAITSSLSSAAICASYVVELVVTKGPSSYCVQRPLPALLEVLQSVHPDAADHDIPEFPLSGNASDAHIAQWCGDMTTFLAARSHFIKDRTEWLAFVEDTADGHGSRTHVTAIEFILQPFAYEKMYIPRGSRHEVVVPITKDEQFLVWKFELEDYDVDFSVQFVPSPLEQPVELVHSQTRYLSTSAGRPVEGMYQCTRAGKATFVWDNTYSRIRGKNILYQIQAVDKDIMESATAAADALDEAVQARKQQSRDEKEKSDQESAEATSTALVVSNAAPPALPTLPLYKSLSDTFVQQSWLLSAPINVAGKVASRLFGSPATEYPDGPQRTDLDARSLLEELNGLNMRLMERMESLEDKIAQLTAERDQARSRTQMAAVEKENATTELKSKELELSSIRGELQRMQREREAWREIQTERDALLEEKHRWALTDFIGDDNEVANPPGDLDAETRVQLEHELGRAEATVLRCRAELGYPLSNHLTGTSSRLEKIAQEMSATKRTYEEQMKQWEQEALQLKQQLVKYRGQKRVLVTELRNMKTQSEGQVAVAMAEASEARMVNRRLKKQNELLLTQIRTLINDAEETDKKLRELQDRALQADTKMKPPSDSEGENSTGAEDVATALGEDEEAEEDQSVPYTLSDADIALLNGQSRAHQLPDAEGAGEEVASPPSSPRMDRAENPYRERLVAFFEERDPQMLPEVDDMLESYRGVEESLFESLELKYSFMELNQRIVQAL